MHESELDTVQIAKTTIELPYEKFGYIITEDMFSNKIIEKLNDKETINKILVTPSDNLRIVLENITDASDTNKYEIHLSEGEYDIMGLYSKDEYTNTSFIGLQTKDHVSLIGIGDKRKVILKGELPSDTDSTTMARVSTLVTKGNGRLENLTVTGHHLRYAVHDDYRDGGEIERVVKDCIFIKTGWGYNQAYGSGVYSGQKQYFENCEFYSNTSLAYSCHNNTGFTKPASIKLIGCKFVNDIEGEPSVRFGSMGSGQNDEIQIIGCEMNNHLLIKEEQSNGAGIDFIVKGYANDVFDVEVQGTTTKTITNTNGFIKTVE